MPTLTQVRQQIKALGEVDTFGTKKEIKYLPDILDKNETILALTSGIMDGDTWLIVCTEKRVIFLDKGMIYGLTQRETPLEKINSIEQKTGMIFGSIGIRDGASLMKIGQIDKRTVRPFVAAVNRARDTMKSAEARNRSSVSNSDGDQPGVFLGDVSVAEDPPSPAPAEPTSQLPPSKDEDGTVPSAAFNDKLAAAVDCIKGIFAFIVLGLLVWLGWGMYSIATHVPTEAEIAEKEARYEANARAAFGRELRESMEERNEAIERERSRRSMGNYTGTDW